MSPFRAPFPARGARRERAVAARAVLRPPGLHWRQGAVGPGETASPRRPAFHPGPPSQHCRICFRYQLMMMRPSERLLFRIWSYA
jgi:hypothetical protein